MKKTTPFIFIIISLFSFLQIDCKKEPPIVPPIEIPPGSRDYMWTVDTLKPPPGDIVYLISMWGSSEKDIWATGFGDASYNCIWHYDGVTWRRDSIPLSSNHFSVFGFAQNDVWIVDAPNGERIWHYNGSQWSLFGNYKKPNQFALDLGNIWGDAPNNIWAVGSEISASDNKNHAVIMKYDGKNWNYTNIQEIDVSFYKIRKDNPTGKYYLYGTRFTSSGDTDMVFMFDGITLQHLISSPKTISVNKLSDRVHIQIDKKIYTAQNTELKLFKDFSGSDFIGRLWGRNEKDFFSVGSNGLMHYNGENLQLIYPTATSLFDVEIFTNDVFVISKTGDYPIVIHGVLKK